MISPYLQALLESLWGERLRAGQEVWCILDGARDRRIYGAVVGCYEERACLYSGTLAPELAIAAPYLVQLSRGSHFTRYILKQGWGNSWGIFFHTGADLRRLRRHFREFLLVRDERGKRLMFRYFDPRVLRVYLPTCVSLELQTIFGPIDNYLVEGEEPDTLLEFRRKSGELVQQAVHLAREPARAVAAAT